MKRFQYYEPKTFEQATSLLHHFKGAASLLAGGTDLLVEMKERLRHCEHVVNIKKIPDMSQLEYSEQGGLKIGALVTTRLIETDVSVRTIYPALAQAASELGSIQVRNRATVVGNLCRASPSADTIPPLIAARAVVHIRGESGTRTVELESFFTGPGKTVLAPDEIVSQITLPPPGSGTRSVYIKHGRRKAMELATVGVAVTLALDGNVCRDIRIVLGAVAPTPIRAKQAEQVLRGHAIGVSAFKQAAEEAMRECTPISNVRSSADYRREMVRVITNRAFCQAVESAP
jgi:carbon-monoxide dehydrogenase medium subunit